MEREIYYTTKEEALEAIKQSDYALQFASAKLQDDREVVLTAVKQNGCALQYASDKLQGDREIALLVNR